MLRYQFEWVANGDLRQVNRLLAHGWRPVREQQIPGEAPSGSGCHDLLVVLERDDEFPIFSGELLAEGAPLDFLQGVPLLHGLTGCEVRELAAKSEVRRYEAETVLFDEGQTDRRLYVVLEGTVSIQLLGLMIDDPVVLEAGSGDAFGESTFFAPAAHTTRARTATLVRTLELSGAAFDELFQAGRPAACKLALNGAALLGERLQSTDAWMRELLQGEKSADLIRSWRRFRHGLSSRASRPSGGGFVQV